MPNLFRRKINCGRVQANHDDLGTSSDGKGKDETWEECKDELTNIHLERPEDSRESVNHEFTVGMLDDIGEQAIIQDSQNDQYPVLTHPHLNHLQLNIAQAHSIPEASLRGVGLVR
jgi:hypothetical protein